MTDEAIRILTVILWLGVPSVLIVVDLVIARYFYGLWTALRGGPGSRLLAVMMVTISLGAISQALAVANAYRLVLFGAAGTGGVAVTLALYLIAQVLNGAGIVYKAWAVNRITTKRPRPPDESEAGVTGL